MQLALPSLFLISMAILLIGGQDVYEGMFFVNDDGHMEYIDGPLEIEDLDQYDPETQLSTSSSKTHSNLKGDPRCSQCMDYFCEGTPCRTYDCRRCGGYKYDCKPKCPSKNTCNCNCKFDKDPLCICKPTVVCNNSSSSSQRASTCNIERTRIDQCLGGFGTSNYLGVFNAETPNGRVLIPASGSVTRDLIGIVMNTTVRVIGSTTITFNTGTGSGVAFTKIISCSTNRSTCDVDLCEYDPFGAVTLSAISSGGPLLTVTVTNGATVTGTVTAISCGNA